MSIECTVTRAEVVEWMVNPDVDFEEKVEELHPEEVRDLTMEFKGWHKLPEEDVHTLTDRFVAVGGDIEEVRG